MRLGWKVFIPVTLVWLCVEAAMWILQGRAVGRVR